MSLRFSDGTVPTYLGLLVAGRDPRYWIPGAYAQFTRFDGLDLSDPILDEKEITGPLSKMIRELYEALKINISTAVDPTAGPVEARRADFPLEALQQIANNAVLHRASDGTNAPVQVYWFSDRIEIRSPGGPFGRVNRQNFGEPGLNDYRNPHLAEAMKTLGFVQRFGAGIGIANRAMEKNGNPPVEFTVEETHVLATLRKRQ